jgi:hypothetical protein
MVRQVSMQDSILHHIRYTQPHGVAKVWCRIASNGEDFNKRWSCRITLLTTFVYVWSRPLRLGLSSRASSNRCISLESAFSNSELSSKFRTPNNSVELDAISSITKVLSGGVSLHTLNTIPKAVRICRHVHRMAGCHARLGHGLTVPHTEPSRVEIQVPAPGGVLPKNVAETD